MMEIKDYRKKTTEFFPRFIELDIKHIYSEDFLFKVEPRLKDNLNQVNETLAYVSFLLAVDSECELDEKELDENVVFEFLVDELDCWKHFNFSKNYNLIDIIKEQIQRVKKLKLEEVSDIILTCKNFCSIENGEFLPYNYLLLSDEMNCFDEVVTIELQEDIIKLEKYERTSSEN